MPRYCNVLSLKEAKGSCSHRPNLASRFRDQISRNEYPLPVRNKGLDFEMWDINRKTGEDNRCR